MQTPPSAKHAVPEDTPEPEAKEELVMRVDLGELEALATSSQREERGTDAATTRPVQFPKGFSMGNAGTADADSAAVDERISFEKSYFRDLEVVGQFNLGFIIAALPNSGGAESARGAQIFIIDQHAADECARFERFVREFQLQRQALITPMAVALSPAEEQRVQAHLDVLELNGFLVDWNDSQPPGKRVLLRELPVAKGTMFGVEDFRELLGLIGQAEDEGMFRTRAGTGGIHSRSGEAPPPRPRKVWSVLVSKACRSAIMIGTALKRREMAEECAAMADLDHPWNCPHGRPTMRHLSDLRAVRMEKLETLLKPEQLERLGVC
jgi:DNA mismatch repair protein PMS2